MGYPQIKKKQGPIRHKPWPIQKVKDFQDSCRLSSQFPSMSQSQLVSQSVSQSISQSENFCPDPP